MGLISIIVPVYNSEKYIEQCIQSLVQQTYHNIEIIIVDDGSVDGTETIARYYQSVDSRIKYVYQNNLGVSEARNRGLEYSTGEYIMFVDSDDWIDDITCYSAVEAINKYQADVVMWPYCREYVGISKPTLFLGDTLKIWKEENSYTLWRRMIGPVGKELECPQMLDSLITVWGKLYKKEVLRNYRFSDIKIIGTEDTWFNIQVFKNIKNAVYIPQPLSHYRKIDSTSLTHSYKAEKVYQWMELYKRITKLLKNDKVDRSFYMALKNRICLGIIGLGLNLEEDISLRYIDKYKYLKAILEMPHYKKSLKQLENSYLPLHWKVFFFMAKHNCVNGMLILLKLMNWLRRH